MWPKIKFVFLLIFYLIFIDSHGFADEMGCDFGERLEQYRWRMQNNLNVASDPRPIAKFIIESPRIPAVIHYGDSVTIEYAKMILQRLEVSWQRFFDEMNFRIPRPDGVLGGDERFDIYIVDNLPAGVGGYAGFSDYYEVTPEADAFGYLVISDKLSAKISGFVVSHELFHASQMAYDWWEDLSFMEGTATWMTEHVFPTDDLYAKFFPYFNQESFLALDFISLKNPYQYGSGLWWNFLDERWGNRDGSVIRRVWESTPQIAWDNEPDFLDATQEVLQQIKFEDAFRMFGMWRVLLGEYADYGFFQERQLWPENVGAFFMGRWQEMELPQSITNFSGLMPFGQSFVSIAGEKSSKTASRLELILHNKGSCRLAVEILNLSATSGVQRIDGGIANAAEALRVYWERSVGVGESIVQISNLGDGRYDPESSEWDFCQFDLEIKK